MYNYITIIFLLFSSFLPNIGLSFNDIMKAQNILTELGYEPGPVDGVWGGKTRKALNNFYQENKNIINDFLSFLINSLAFFLVFKNFISSLSDNPI